MATGLEPSLFCAYIAKYDTHIMHSYIVYPLASASV
nr:MAG TPA: hypothetical protein [Bacteriophage sp.]